MAGMGATRREAPGRRTGIRTDGGKRGAGNGTVGGTGTIGTGEPLIQFIGFWWGDVVRMWLENGMQI